MQEVVAVFDLSGHDTFSVQAEDYLGNATEWQTITLEKDETPPTLQGTQIQYAQGSGANTYLVTVTVHATDEQPGGPPGSGVKQVRLEFAPGSSGVTGADGSELPGGVLPFQPIGDGLFEGRFTVEANTLLDTRLVLTDHVSNETESAYQFQVPALPIVDDDPAITRFTRTGGDRLHVGVIVGADYRHEAYGFEAMTLRYRPVQQPPAGWATVDLLAATPGGTTLLPGGLVHLEYSFAVPALSSHAQYETEGSVTLRNGLGGLDWGQYTLELPNLALAADNDFLLNLRKDGRTVSSRTAANLLQGSQPPADPIYFRDTLDLELTPPTDKEGDRLELFYTGSDGVPVYGQQQGTVYRLPVSVRADAVYIRERNGSWEASRQLDFKLVKDSALDPAAFVLEITDEADVASALPVCADGSFSCRSSEQAPDPSGIALRLLFDADYLVGADGPDFTRFDGNGLDITAARQGEVVFADPAGEEREHTVGLLIEDGAGNRLFKSRKVVVDRKAPDFFDLGGDSIVQLGEGIDYQFDPGTRSVRLVPDAQAKDSGRFATALIAYHLDWRGPEGFPAEELPTDQSCRITLPEGFVSNQPLEVTLRVTDYVGNATERTLQAYAPVRLQGPVSRYLVERTEEWSEGQGHFLAWEPLVSAEAASYRLYRLAGEAEVLLADFSDDEVASHGTAAYRLTGINGSGYQSRFAGSTLEFSRTLRNNSPVLAAFEARGGCTDGGLRLFLGPLSGFTLQERDLDAGDRLQARFYVDGTPWTTVELSGTGHDEIGLPEVEGGGSAWGNDATYTVRVALVDRWTLPDGSAAEGQESLSGPLTFTYDSEGPRLSGHLLETRPGYRYGYGDLFLAVQDNQAGLDGATLSVRLADGAGLAYQPIEEPAGYTHRVSGLPDGRKLTVSVEAADRLGNRGGGQVRELDKDTVPPEVVGLACSSALWEGRFLVNRPLVPVAVGWTDDNSGIADLRYRLILDGAVATEDAIHAYGSWLELPAGTWNSRLPVSQTAGETASCRLEVQVVDHAGNSSAWAELAGGLGFDFDPPRVTLEPVQGLLYAYGKPFFNGAGLSIGLKAEDGHGIAETWFELDDGQGVEEAYASFDELLPVLRSGGAYTVRGAARDNAGNTGRSLPVSFACDSLPPAAGSLGLELITPQASYAPGEPVRFRLTGEDADSAVVRYFLWVGRTVGGAEVPELSARVPGHLGDGTVPYPAAAGEAIHELVVPDCADGVYRIRIVAEDAAGNRTGAVPLESPALTVSGSGERIAVFDYSPFSSNPAELRASWRYLGSNSINHYLYRVVRASDGHAVGDWQETLAASAAAAFEPPLASGEVYRFQVQAVCDDGSRVPVSSSRGTLIDTRPPDILRAAVPVYCSPTTMSLDWEAKDGESSVRRIEAVLETYRRDAEGNVPASEEGVPLRAQVGVVELQPSEAQSGYPLGLAETEPLERAAASGDLVFVTLRATDDAGNTAERFAGAMTLDITPPPRPAVVDPGYYLNPDRNDLRFNWYGTADDPESGSAVFRYQLLGEDAPLDEAAWVERSGREVVLPGPASVADGEAVLLAVQAVNGAGLSSVGFSDGIVLDRSRPAMPVVALGALEGEGTERYWARRQAWLHVLSTDAESGVVEHSYQAGVYRDSAWGAAGEPGRVAADAVPVEVLIPDTVGSGDLVSYRTDSYNGAGDICALPGYSPGVMFDDSVPAVVSVTGRYEAGGLTYSWQTAGSRSPLREITVVLRRDGAEVTRATFPGTQRCSRFEQGADELPLPDGAYTLEVSCVNQAGTGSAAARVSNAVLLDRVPPAIADATCDRYVVDRLRWSASAQDNATGIAGYRYQLGVAGDPGRLSGGWVAVEQAGGMASGELLFARDLPGGVDAVKHLDELILSVQAGDRAGNWSAARPSDPILVDRTPPRVTELDQDRSLRVGDQVYQKEGRYITRPDRIEALYFAGLDAESGLTGYRWALVPAEGPVPAGTTWSELIPLADGADFSKGVRLEQLALLPAAPLADGERYRLALRLKNRAGADSEAGLSPLLLVDLSPPRFAVDYACSGVGIETAGEGATRLIYNAAGKVHLAVQEAGEYLAGMYSLVGPSGAEVDSGGFSLVGEAAAFEVPFDPGAGAAFGEYRLSITLADQGGRSEQLLQRIRLNAPPAVALTEIGTTPGKPTRLAEGSTIADPDGITGYVFRLYLGEEQVDQWTPADPLAWEGRFHHADARDAVTRYRLEVEAVDRYGQAGRGSAALNVENTKEGPLYADEVWSGTHRLTGAVTVGAGRTLTLAPATEVRAAINPATGSGQAVVVEAGGALVHEGAARYTVEAGDPAARWEGLVIRGRANLADVTVERARRGIVLAAGAQVGAVTRCAFLDNLIGLHLVGISPAVSDSRFVGNRHYGVKEDAGAHPAMVRNVFSGNGYPYYQEGASLLTVDELNRVQGNRGNSEE